MVRQVEVRIEGITTYSSSKMITPKAKDFRGTDLDWEEAHWQERMNLDREGRWVIPAYAVKMMLVTAAKNGGWVIPGRGKCTYTKPFDRGLLVLENPLIEPETRADNVKGENGPIPCVQGEWLMVPSDGKRGGARRVAKCFPVIHRWACDITYQVLEDVISKEIFEQALNDAGMFVGLGRWRPENGGLNGRFQVVGKAKWSEIKA